MTPQVVAFRLDDLLHPLSAEFRVLAHEKGLELRCVPTGAWVRSDPQLLRRVLQNFLGNAVRYTAQGRILIGCRRLGDQLRIEVWDTGPGIALADRGVIFEEFRRLDRGGQGLGLGLAIAERVSRLLGHPLGLHSEPGCGTGFWIDVPRSEAVPLPPQAPGEAMPQAPRSRVLVVDNDAAVLQAMRTLLETWQCQVFAARTREEAQAQFTAASPELLLLDFHLDGGLTGLELREQLGRDARALPCVIITADHDPGIRAQVEAAGALLLYKPLKPLALKSVMARLMAVRRDATHAGEAGASSTK